MQRFFIHFHCQKESRSFHGVYLGECRQAEAEARFSDAVNEIGQFELITLHNGAGQEIGRHVRIQKQQPVKQTGRHWLSGWRELLHPLHSA